MLSANKTLFEVRWGIKVASFPLRAVSLCLRDKLSTSADNTDWCTAPPWWQQHATTTGFQQLGINHKYGINFLLAY